MGGGTCAETRRDVRRVAKRRRAESHAGVDIVWAHVWARVCLECSSPHCDETGEKKTEKRGDEREKEKERERVVRIIGGGANKRVVAVVRCGVGFGISSYSISTLPSPLSLFSTPPGEPPPAVERSLPLRRLPRAALGAATFSALARITPAIF